jgi:hypothetical protein
VFLPTIYEVLHILEHTHRHAHIHTHEMPNYSNKVKKKTISITGHDGLRGCEILKISHYLDSRLADGSKVVSHTHWQPKQQNAEIQHHYILV